MEKGEDAWQRRSLRKMIAADPEALFNHNSDGLNYDAWNEICHAYVDKVDPGTVRSLFDELAQGSERISRSRFSRAAARYRSLRQFVEESACVDLLVEGLAAMVAAKALEDTKNVSVQEVLAQISAEEERALAANVVAALRWQAELAKEKLASDAKAPAAAAFGTADAHTGKFAHLPEAAFGTTADFHRGLEVVGVPHPRACEEMRKEHQEKDDSHDEFESWNSGKIATCTATEWDFVVAPFKLESVSKHSPPSSWAPQHDYGGGRVPIRPEVILHAAAANRGDLAFGDYKRADDLEPSDGRWLHSEEVDQVRVVLLRFVTSQLDATSLCAVWQKMKRPLNKSVAGARAGKMADALAAYLAETDGPSSTSSFEGAVAALVKDGVATGQELEAVIDHFQAKLRKQKLTEPEVIAARLYTGPCYVKMNASLRHASGTLPDCLAAHLKGNRYTNTIYLCASAMLKISGASRIPLDRKIYRGMAGIRLPDLFQVEGEDGGKGGADFAFMSASTKRHVAVGYIKTEKGLPVLFEIDVGSIDRGAPLSFLSQFPGENEILIPPLSYLEVMGAPYTWALGKAEVTVYPARINCNLKSQTMEQIEARRSADLLAQGPYLREELKRDVPPVLRVLSDYRFTMEVYNMRQEAEAEFGVIWKELQTHHTRWFNNDANYVDAIARAFKFKHDLLAEAVRLTLQEDPTSRRPALFAAVESEAVEVVEKLLSVEGAAVDAADQEGTTAAQFAAERGCAAALAVLADAGADLCAARRDGATALARAVVPGLVSKHTSDTTRLILERTSPRVLESVERDALGRPRIEDGLMRMRDPLLPALARAFMSPAALAERLGRVSPAGLKGEIGALLRSTDLPDAAKAGLGKVRAFIDLHSSLLDSADPGLPHRGTRVWQLASQEPDDVFGAYADIVAAARAAKHAPGLTEAPRLLEWLNKPQDPHPCRLTFEGQPSEAREAGIHCVACSPCGNLLARAEGKAVIVSDAVTLFERCRFLGHTADVKSVVFNPANPDELASGSCDECVKLWSIATRVCKRTINAHTDDVSSLIFPTLLDNDTLVSASYDCTIKIWRISDGSCQASLETSDSIYSVALSPDGKLLASGGRDRKVSLWQVETGTLLAALEGHNFAVSCVDFNPRNGDILASGSFDFTLKIWSLSDGTCTQTLVGHTGWVLSVRWRPDGSLLASSGEYGEVRIWTREGGCVNIIQGHSKANTSCACYFSERGLLKESNPACPVQSHSGTVHSMDWTPDGSLLVSGGGLGDCRVKLWSPAGADARATMPANSSQPRGMVAGELVQLEGDAGRKTGSASGGGEKDALGVCAAGSSRAVGEQVVGRYIISAREDMVLVHEQVERDRHTTSPSSSPSFSSSSSSSSAARPCVAFFASPRAISTIACLGEDVSIGCRDGTVLKLRATWLAS